MAQRIVVKAHTKLFPHTGAERLELCKVGTFQLVVQKGLYVDGDVIIVALEKALRSSEYIDMTAQTRGTTGGGEE